MKKIEIHTICKKLLADVFTPVGIYLRLRDRFRDTILLESTDHHAAENSYSFICINAIGGMEITSTKSVEFKLPAHTPEKVAIKNISDVPQLLWDFMQRFDVQKSDTREARYAQGLFGYTSYDAVQFFETLQLGSSKTSPPVAGGVPIAIGMEGTIPLMRYRLYQYVIAVNHFKDELFICENVITGLESELAAVELLIRSKDVRVYPFKIKAEEKSNITD